MAVSGASFIRLKAVCDCCAVSSFFSALGSNPIVQQTFQTLIQDGESYLEQLAQQGIQELISLIQGGGSSGGQSGMSSSPTSVPLCAGLTV